MAFISNEEVNGQPFVHLAPMIDFLFLMVVFFAAVAVSRANTCDTEINLVKLERQESSKKPSKQELHFINLVVSEQGNYKWMTDLHDYQMADAAEVAKEIAIQYERGILSEDKKKTKVLLRIDRKAEWEPIMKVIFAIRDLGFEVRPVYDPEKEKSSEHSVAISK